MSCTSPLPGRDPHRRKRRPDLRKALAVPQGLGACKGGEDKEQDRRQKKTSKGRKKQGFSGLSRRLMDGDLQDAASCREEQQKEGDASFCRKENQRRILRIKDRIERP